MKESILDKTEKRILWGLFLLAVLLVALLMSGHDDLFGKIGRQTNPFITDRVVCVHIRMAEKDWQRLLSNSRAKEYFRADFWFDGRRYPNVAVRAKGNSSLMSVAGSGNKRVSLKVDFNFFNSAQTFCGLKKLCLNNGFSDPTFMREVLGYELFEQMDIPTPRASFVDLYVNNLHMGLYTQVEPIDKAFLVRHFSNPDGNLYKPEIGAASLNWTREDLEKTESNSPDPRRKRQNNALAVNLGGSRLSDLLRLLEREENIDQGDTGEDENQPGNPFARGPGGGPFPPGDFPFDPNQRSPGMNRRWPGNFRDDAGPFAGGFPPARPNDPNGFFENPGRPPFGGMDRRFGVDPNVFAGGPDRPWGFRPGRSQRPEGPGRGFPGRGGPGGPGGPPGFGRGNLLETMGLKTNENYPNHTVLFRLLEVLNKCPDESFPAEIEKVLDVDQVLRYLAVSVLTVHLDNYIGMGHNYYLYEIDGRFTILPWDLNMAFGVFKMGVFQEEVADFFIDEPVAGLADERPLVKRLLAYQPYLDRYHQYLEQLLDKGFAEGVIESRIDQCAVLIRPYVEKDEMKVFSMDDFEKGLAGGSDGDMRRMRPFGRTESTNESSDSQPRDRQGRFGGLPGRGGGAPGGGPGGMGAPGLKSFIAKRRISVRNQLSGLAASRPTAEQREQAGQRQFRMPGPGGMR